MLRHSVRRASPEEAEIYAPEFPAGLDWLNVAFLRMNTLMGRGAVLVEFWDFARVNSLRTLPYLKEWHARYADAGLRVIGVHTPGLLVRARPRHGGPRGRAARDRLPGAARPRASRRGGSTATAAGRAATCSTAPASWRYIHYGEGEYEDTELRDQECVGDRRCEPLAPGAPRGRARACCSSRRPRTSRCPPTATGSSWCATGPTARTGSRPPTRAPRPASSSAPAAPTRCCPAPRVEPGLYESDGTVEAESPGLRLHGVQFTPAPPAPADLLREHEAHVLLDDLELRDVRRCRARGRSRPAAAPAPRARSRRSVMPTTRLPSSHSSRTWLSLSIRCDSAPWSRATSTRRFEFDELLRADHEHEVALARHLADGDLAVRRGVTDVVGLRAR